MTAADKKVRWECRRLRLAGLEAAFREELDAILVKALPLPGRDTWRNRDGVAVFSLPVLIGVDDGSYPDTGAWIGSQHPDCAIHIPRVTYGGEALEGLRRCACRRSWRSWWWLRFTRRPPYMDPEDLVSVVSAIQFSLRERAAPVLSPDKDYL